MDKLFDDEPALLVDAYAWIFRAYYGLPDFRNSAGQPTAAVHGFLTMIPKLAQFAAEESGARAELVIFFDRGGPQERLAAYADYKANRPETPENLKTQVPLIEEALEAMNLPVVAMEGVEADDAIASRAATLAAAGRRVYIASNDKDFFQLLSDRIRLIRSATGAEEFRVFDRMSLQEKFGLEPDVMADFYAMVGDAVDNVPGVKGIGEKTAAKLLKHFKTLDGVYENLPQMPKTTAGILSRGRESAYLSRDLVRLRTDLKVTAVPTPFDPARFDRPRLESLLSRLELRRLSDRLLGAGATS